MIVAAIEYMEDQNCPSSPFLLDLDCTEHSTVEDLKDAILKAVLEILDDDDDPITMESLIVQSGSEWGDFEVSSDVGIYVFIGLPDRVRARLFDASR